MAMIENILKTPTTIEVVFDAKMSNPNGDPDNENAPRQNSEGFGYMTPECIKYKIRNVLNIMANFGEIDPDTNHLYCSPDTYSIESSIRECFGKKPSDFKKLTFEDELTMRKKLCNYFVDARWFGMVNTSYSSYNTLGKIEGAFQLSFPMSYDPIRIASISNTRCCVSSDDERKGNEMRFVLQKWEAANPEEAALGNPLGYKDVSRRRYAEKLDSIAMTHCLYGDLENILPKEFSVARI